MERLLKSGVGWRIGWNPHGKIYQGLVGTDDWAIELTKDELEDFCRLLPQLAETMESMKGELMDEERIACESESELLWLELEGFADAYCLRLIVNHNRRCEGNWSESATKELIAVTKNLIGF